MSHEHRVESPRKPKSHFPPVEFGQDVDFVVGVTAAALTGDQLLKATHGEHKTSHLIKAGLGAALAAGAFTLMKKEHDEKQHDKERRQQHHHDQAVHHHGHHHHDGRNHEPEPAESRGVRARSADGAYASSETASRRPIEANGVPLGRRISYQRRSDDHVDRVPVGRRRQSADRDDESTDSADPEPVYRRGRSHSPHQYGRR